MIGLEQVVDEYVRVAPSGPLRPFVGWYSGYRQCGVPPAVHRGLPSPYLTLIFTLDDPLTVLRHPDTAQPAADYATLLGGLHTTPALIAHDGAQSGVQVALSPLGCRALFGVAAGELAGIDVPAEEVIGPLAAQVRERLLEAASWPDRMGALDSLLAGRLLLAGEPAPAPEVVRAWQLIMASRGTASVRDVASEIGWTTRNLGRRFGAEIGLAPKLAARVVRFDHARRQLGAAVARGRTVADVAAATGYADQAHLARDFRELAGCSPSGWLAEEFRNVQAEAESAVPGWWPDADDL